MNALVNFVRGLFGVIPNAEITLGKHNITVDFGDGTETPALILEGYVEDVTELTVEGIVAAARAVVGRKVADDQIDLDRQRLVEDVRRALGN